MNFIKDELEASGELLISRKLTVAVAESVTSGFLQAAFSSVTNARKFFQGGITAYNLGQKVRHLQVEPIEAESSNCVSAYVAGEMANQVRQMFLSNFGISITGYAAPVPEIGIEDVYAFYSISYNGDEVKSGKLESTVLDSVEVQLYFTNKVIAAFHDVLVNMQLSI